MALPLSRLKQKLKLKLDVSAVSWSAGLVRVLTTTSDLYLLPVVTDQFQVS